MGCVPVVIPVRFAVDGTVIQTTTRELSREAVVVRCLQPPPQGSRVELHLYLPGLGAPLAVGGEVSEVLAEGAEGGFRARFDPLSPILAAEIGGLVDRRKRAPSPKAGEAVGLPPPREERAFPRVPARFAVRFGSVQDFVLEYAANLSAGGLFIETRTPPPRDAVVRVSMELPGSAEPVVASGLVVHRVTVEEAQERDTTPGVGVQFVDADDAFRERLDAAIDAILKNRAPPADSPA